MPYPEALVAPMRAELTRLGVTELVDGAAVDQAFSDTSGVTTLLVVNSVCGCAAANARPAVALARQTADVQPDRYVTVFAGQDIEATERARRYLPGIPPSSPFIALFQEDEPVFVLERRHIEGRSASAIANDLVDAFSAHCTAEGSRDGASADMPEVRSDEEQDTIPDKSLPDTFRSIL
ncbi:MAG: BrxA/BrxB family bacilliredoxin [Rhodothermia bacterium]|nr:BrxA/BrxB family bacilliredoxin [Rhodothermia bacterium]